MINIKIELRFFGLWENLISPDKREINVKCGISGRELLKYLEKILPNDLSKDVLYESIFIEGNTGEFEPLKDHDEVLENSTIVFISFLEGG